MAQVGSSVCVLFSAYFTFWFVFLYGYSKAPLDLLVEVLVTLGICVALGLSLTHIARKQDLTPDRLSNLGLSILLALCLILSLFAVYLGQQVGLPPARMSLAALAAVAYPLFVPTSRGRLIVIALLASATQPLALLLCPPPSLTPEVLDSSVVSALITAATAVLIGSVVEGIRNLARQTPELGAYRLLRRLDRTETTETWQAQHQFLVRPAVVKWVRQPKHIGLLPKVVVHFEREAQLVSSLSSPHTVTLFDFGVTPQNDFFYVTEYLEGQSLASYVSAHGPLAPRQALRVALELADSVADAHERGAAHGNLEAKNVLLCQVGQRTDFVKVLGYGIAEHSDELAREVDAPLRRQRVRSDVEGLGRLIYFMATGRQIAPAASPRIERPWPARAVTYGEAATLNLLEQLVDRCLGAHSTQPFKNAVEVYASLKSSGAATGVTHAHVSAVQHPTERGGRRDAQSSGSRARGQRALWPSAWKTSFTPTLTNILPPTQQAAARKRLGQLARIAFFIALATCLVWILFGKGTWTTSDYVLFLIGYGISMGLDVVMLLITTSRLSHRTVLSLSLVYLTLRVGALSMTNLVIHAASNLQQPRMGFGAVGIVVFALLVPTPPRRLLVAALCGGLLQPLMILWLWPGPIDRAALIDNALVAAFAVTLSYWIAATSRQLHVAVERSREVGSYELLEVIGRGSMGEVWRARHELLARPAALKTIRWTQEGQDPRAAWRFSREAQITASLRSPHTVRLFDHGVSRSGTWYYAMELLEGQDLQRLVDRHGPLPARQVVDIGLQVCDSLWEAHSQGLVHRDLKPSNLFLCRAGCREDFIKVLDFGLARVAEPIDPEPEPVTLTTGHGHIIGTPAYMAPELFLGQAADTRSDIYSLGCVLFFLLTGQRVFERSSTIATAVARLNETAPAVSSRASGAIPPDLDDVIARCLARQPGERFASIAELEQALRRVRLHADDLEPSTADPARAAGL